MHKKIIDLLRKNYLLFIIIFMILNIFFIAGIFRLKTNNGFYLFNIENSKINKKYNKIKELLNNAEEIFYIVRLNNYIETLNDLKDIKKMQDDISSIKGVSFISGPSPEYYFIDKKIRQFALLKEDDVKKILNSYNKMEELNPVLESKGFCYCLFNVYFEKDADYIGIIDRIDSYFKHKELIFYAGGETYIKKKVYDYVMLVTFIFPPAAMILILLFFRLHIGGIKAALYSVIPASVGTLWLLGTMGWLNIELTMAASMTPLIVLVIGSAEGLHFVSHFTTERNADIDNAEVLKNTLSKIGVPMILTSVSTVIGFLSALNINSLGLRIFSLLAALGIVYAGINTGISLPLILLKVKKISIDGKKINNKITGFIRNLWGAKTVVITIILIIVSMIGMFMIRSKFSVLSMFGRRTAVMRNIRIINELGFGTVPVIISVETKSDPLETDTARKVLKLESELKQKKLITKSMSIYRTIGIFNKIFEDQDDLIYPDNLIRINLFFSILDQGDRKLTSNMISRPDRFGRVIIFPVNLDNDILDSIERTVNDYNDEETFFTVTGLQSAVREMNEKTMTNQILTIIISLGFNFILILIFYRKLLFSLLTMIPITITLLTMYGMMGIFNISLNFFTSVMFGIMIGIGIDYSIYVSSLFLYYKKNGISTADAIDRSFRFSADPILANALGHAVGLSPLIFSPLLYQSQFAVISCLSMVIAAMLGLMFLPTILAAVYKDKKTNFSGGVNAQ